MTLSDLKAFMVERKRASVAEISLHFDSPPSAIQPMIEQWMAKGRMRKLNMQGGCGKAGSGCSCKEAPVDIYEWSPSPQR